jgi:hypothetical protein
MLRDSSVITRDGLQHNAFLQPNTDLLVQKCVLIPMLSISVQLPQHLSEAPRVGVIIGGTIGVITTGVGHDLVHHSKDELLW